MKPLLWKKKKIVVNDKKNKRRNTLHTSSIGGVAGSGNARRRDAGDDGLVGQLALAVDVDERARGGAGGGDEAGQRAAGEVGDALGAGQGGGASEECYGGELHCNESGGFEGRRESVW